MTSPIGRSPIGRKHSPSVGRPFLKTIEHSPSPALHDLERQIAEANADLARVEPEPIAEPEPEPNNLRVILSEGLRARRAMMRDEVD